MDDYLSKPLRLNELGPMLAKWLPLSGVSPGATTAAETAADAAVTDAVPPAPTSLLASWDATVLTRMVGDNPAMQRRLLEKFLISAEDQVTRIVAAAAIDDTATAGNVAHALKSAARAVGALRLGDLCEQLETAGRAGVGSTCAALAQSLTGTFADATKHIARHMESLS
jgi:HPt (histidine-containing phosphotransfer) domain-containing protein